MKTERHLLLTPLHVHGKPIEIVHDIGRQSEREALINLLKKKFGEDYYELGVCGQIVELIRSRYYAREE